MHLRSTWRIVVRAAVAATALAGGLVVGTGQAALANESPVYTFVPISLSVTDTEDDNWFPFTDKRDEPHLAYGGSDWYGLVRRGDNDISDMAPVDFTGYSIQAELWERDGGWVDNDFLGEQTVTNDFLGQELEINFRNGVNYEFRYKVIRKS